MKKILFTSLILVVEIFISCSGSENLRKNDEPIFYPPPPDEPRIQYLTSISSSNDISGEQSTITKFVVGEEEPLVIIKPYGLAARTDKIFICDTQLSALIVIDLAERSLGYFTPQGRGKLKKPINCFIDEEGLLYVADSERGQIIIFDNELNYRGEIGDSLILKPTDVFVDENKIYLNDISSRKVNIYDKTSLKYLRSIPSESEKKNQLYSPANISVSKKKIYVSDLGDSRIKVYDEKGNHIKTIGDIGNTPGKFSRPKGVAVDADGNIYVVDAGFENVQVFNSEGELLMFFGGSYSKPGDMWLPAKIFVDYKNINFFEDFVDPAFELKYLIYVTNQYGPDKINVYGFLSPKEIQK